jgi:hypothetical protein
MSGNKVESKSLDAIVIGDNPPLGQSSLDLCLRPEDLTLLRPVMVHWWVSMTSFSLEIALCRLKKSFGIWKMMACLIEDENRSRAVCQR